MESSDPVLDFIKAGGFRAVPDPEGDRVRARAQELVLAALGSRARTDAEQVVGQMLSRIVSLNRFGGGPVAAAEFLTDALCRGVPQVGDGPEWAEATRLAGMMLAGRLTADVGMSTVAQQAILDDEVAVRVLRVLLEAVVERVHFFSNLWMQAEVQAPH